MKRQRSRVVIAWLLLTLFVSLQLLSGVHRHEEVTSATIDCMECAHHVHHSGHFAASDIHLDDCLLCQFLHFVYLAAASAVLVPLIISTQSRRFFLNSMIICKEPSVRFTRGPPVKE